MLRLRICLHVAHSQCKRKPHMFPTNLLLDILCENFSNQEQPLLQQFLYLFVLLIAFLVYLRVRTINCRAISCSSLMLCFPTDGGPHRSYSALFLSISINLFIIHCFSIALGESVYEKYHSFQMNFVIFNWTIWMICNRRRPQYWNNFCESREEVSICMCAAWWSRCMCRISYNRRFSFIKDPTWTCDADKLKEHLNKFTTKWRDNKFVPHNRAC